MLKRILNKKRLTVIGLNSGTSADGLDMVVVKIEFKKDRTEIRFVKGITIPYPGYLRDMVNQAMQDKSGIDDIIILDRQLGSFYGEKAGAFIDSLRMNIDLVASHGQTIRHLPGKTAIGRKKESGTLQIGHPETIADRTSLVTVADFRQADVASGGEGAPITSYAMWLLFSDKKSSRILVNIGGISNYFYFPRRRLAEHICARDCGPGNTLIDLAAQKYFGRKYDQNGRLAAKGKISQRLLTLLLADNFLKGKYGPSTGRERFGEDYLKKAAKLASSLHLSPHDIMATLTELTAVSIAKSINPLLIGSGTKEIYLFGGGAKNKCLVRRLKYNMPGIEFFSVDRLGVNPDYVEAICYAVMGAMTVHSLPAGLPEITGAKKKAVAGRIVQPGR